MITNLTTELILANSTDRIVSSLLNVADCLGFEMLVHVVEVFLVIEPLGISQNFTELTELLHLSLGFSPHVAIAMPLGPMLTF